jgi:acetyl esterase/lipase
MIRFVLLVVIGALWGSPCLVRAAAAEPSAVINVWPGRPPGETNQLGAERVRVSTSPLPKKEVFNVSTPQLEVFRPAPDKNTGTAIIVCPGGGFSELMMDYEGEDCAAWLNTIGVTGIVLKYRVPQRPGQPRYWAALQDAQRAISLVRSKAGDWDIAQDRIGMLGFSAGGIMAAAAECNFDKRRYAATDDVDKVSCRPDFAVLVYPGTMLQDGQLAPDFQVSKDAPPTFITLAHGDITENSVLFYLSLKKAGVPAELHIYADGAHGFGMRPGDEPHVTWTARLHDWLNYRGLLRSQAK